MNNRRLRYLGAICLSLMILSVQSQGLSGQKKLGTLEVRVTDHREAIGDFKTLKVQISAVGIHEKGQPRRKGWKLFEGLKEEVDLTQYMDGSSVQILRTSIPAGSYNAARLQIDQVIGVLKKDETELKVPFSDSSVAVNFGVQEGQTVVLTFDLGVLDMSDHPGETYKVLIQRILSRAISNRKPEGVLRQYLNALYVHDYKQVYTFVSDRDRRFRTEEEYLKGHESFSGVTLDLAKKLASYIQYKSIQVQLNKQDQASVMVKAILPNGNAPEIYAILFPDDTEAPIPETKRVELMNKLEKLHKTGEMPTQEVEVAFQLVKEKGKWKVFLNWEESIKVIFHAGVKKGLPWEFRVKPAVIYVQPGETVRVNFSAKNLSDKEVTGKARDTFIPKESLAYVELVQCFCFLQYTLDPGESKQFPLIFRVSWDAPEEIKEIHMAYDFYPIEYFEEKWERERQKAREKIL